jgi:putative membrane protein
MGFEWLKPGIVLGSVLYAFIGVAVLWLSFVIIDKITPYNLWEELVEKKNMAVAIVVGAMFIAIGTIVAAAIHG